MLLLFVLISAESTAQCDQLEYSSFYDSSPWAIPDSLNNGEVECFKITSQSTFSTGAIWSDAPINLDNSFEYSYYIQLGSTDANGADGIVFVLNGDPQGQNAIGDWGGGLGYGNPGGINPSVGIEFDTWNNGIAEGDIFNDHAMLHYNGVMNLNSGDAVDLGNIEDGAYHLVQVNWDAVGTTLTVFFDGVLIMTEVNDLVNNVFGGNSEVLPGFTGSTGGAFNLQTVCDFQVIYTEICNGIDDDCDDLIDEDLDTSAQLAVTICEGETFEVGASVYSVPGTYNDILINTAGCDSLVQTILQVNAHATITDNVEICEGETHQQGSSSYSLTGSYTDNYLDIYGCDSIIQTALIVHPIWELDNTVSICDGESYQVGSSVYSVAGTYQDVFASTFQCDSTITSTVLVLDVDTTSISGQFCEGGTFDTPQNSYVTGGNYEEVYTASNGCDSLVQLSLGLILSPTQAQTRAICSGGSFEVGPSVYTSAGTYVDVLQSDLGCDSVVTTHLIIVDELNIPDSTLCVGQSLVLDLSPFPYHEVSGYSAVSGQQYSYEEAGQFPILVNMDGCVLEDEFSLAVLPDIFGLQLEDDFCEGELHELFVRPLGLDYSWNTGETDSIIYAREAGQYIVNYDYRCGDFQDVYTLETSKCACTVYIPNSFTADQDGLNDYFGVVADCDFKAFDLSIYDRNGQVLFHTNDPDKKWNGGVGDYYLPSGIYAWRMVYSPINTELGLKIEERGRVMLIR